MGTKLILSLSAAGIAMAMGLAAASADDLTPKGNNPGERCAAAADKAASTGMVGTADADACKQAVVWSHFVQEAAPAALVNSGILHLARSEYAEAVSDFNAAVQAGADESAVLNDRAIAETGLHQYAAAVADYTKALAQKPDHAERIYFNRAIAYEEQGDLKNAYLDYRVASQLDPSWTKATKELARFTVTHPSMS